MWVLSLSLFFPDHFVGFDHVAQIVLMKTYLSWRSSLLVILPFSFLLEWAFFPASQTIASPVSVLAHCPFQSVMSFWVIHTLYAIPNLNGLEKDEQAWTLTFTSCAISSNTYYHFPTAVIHKLERTHYCPLTLPELSRLLPLFAICGLLW